MTKSPHSIAIDGPTASGKSTVGKLLADRLGYAFLDTGLLYRAVTYLGCIRDKFLSNDSGLNYLAGEGGAIDISTDGKVIFGMRREDITDKLSLPDVDQNVSRVSAVPGVRSSLTRKMRAIASRGNIVMVGRDIGTVVLPNANVKIWLTASLGERAKRRSGDYRKSGELTSYGEILDALTKRDLADAGRDNAPMLRAEDAVIVDTTDLNLEESVNHILEVISKNGRA